MTGMRLRQVWILGAFGLLFGLNEARAGFTVVLDSTTLDNATTVTTFHYDIATTAYDKLTAGDQFTINNFTGYVNGSITAPGNWQLKTAVDAVNPAGSDLTFTYIGTSALVGPTMLSGFSAASQLAGVAIGTFNGSITSTTGLSIPTTGGQLYVPGSGMISPIPAPEPSSLVLGAIGIAAFALQQVRRRRAG